MIGSRLGQTDAFWYLCMSPPYEEMTCFGYISYIIDTTGTHDCNMGSFHLSLMQRKVGKMDFKKTARTAETRVSKYSSNVRGERHVMSGDGPVRRSSALRCSVVIFHRQLNTRRRFLGPSLVYSY